MKAINYNKKNTATIVAAYLALVFALAILFTSCTAYKSGCDMNKGFSGYGKTR